MFTILEGEIELTFRGEAQRASAGSTVNIPANAPHSFKNKSNQPVRLSLHVHASGAGGVLRGGRRPGW
jgi:quercetin dioxygenase-like cupin family protein